MPFAWSVNPYQRCFSSVADIFVRVAIDGTGYDFALDTGSYGITVDPGYAAIMNLTSFNKMQNSANAGRVDTAYARIPLLAVGSLSMHDIVVSENF